MKTAGYTTWQKKIDGTIVQMSMSYWPKLVAMKLKELVGYNHEILGVPDEKLSSYISDKLKKVPIEEFLKGLNKQQTHHLNY